MEQAKSTPAKSTPIVVVIGATGTGKSAVCNILCGDHSRKNFPESEQASSFTYETVGLPAKWFGDDKQGDLFVIDTPGLDDSEGRDSEHISNMIEHLKGARYVSAFIIVWNGQNVRFAKSIKAMMKIFQGMFSPDYMKNTIVLFTRWGFSKEDKYKREKNKDTEVERTKAINFEFQKELGWNTRLHPTPCFFTDSSYNDLEYLSRFGGDSAEEEYKQQLQALKKTIVGFAPFECKDIKTVMGEVDELRAAKELLQKEHENLKKHLQDEVEGIPIESTPPKIEMSLTVQMRISNDTDDDIKDFTLIHRTNDEYYKKPFILTVPLIPARKKTAKFTIVYRLVRPTVIGNILSGPIGFGLNGWGKDYWTISFADEKSTYTTDQNHLLRTDVWFADIEEEDKEEGVLLQILKEKSTGKYKVRMARISGSSSRYLH